MSTKTIIIGKERSKPEKIVLSHVLTASKIFIPARIKASDYSFVELIAQGSDYDIMFAYHTPEKRNDGVLYIGRWNDGVV